MENKLVKFTVCLHKFSNKLPVVDKLRMLGLECDFHEESIYISIQLNYPKQKDILDQINRFDEVYCIEEYVHPTLC